jgi:ferredoxin--NADP+ reductase
MARVISKRNLTPVTKLFVVDAPLIARNARAGQFVMLRVNEAGERVPVTITDFDRKAGTITIVVQVVGKTTAMICALEPGDDVLDFVGPLGKPVTLPSEGHVVLVGGGFGAGAIYTLAAEMKSRGVRVSAIVGARTRDLLILQEELATVTSHVHACTDDGSLGHKGFVTEFLQELLEADVGFTCCYAIGPIAMMRALAEVTRPFEVPTLVSLDPIMVDGTGMCGACRVTVGGQLKFACVDGPFFDAHEVDFAEAVVRSKMYAEEQQLAARMLGLAART